MTYTVEGFPGIVLEEGGTSFDLLIAVLNEFRDKDLPEEFQNYTESRRTRDEINNGKLKVKEKPLRVKENMGKGERQKRKEKLVPVNEKLKGKKKLDPIDENEDEEDFSDDHGEGCSHWYDDDDYIDRQRLKKKRPRQEKKSKGKDTKRSKVNEQLLPNPVLPEEFKNAIRELNGGAEYTGEMMLVMQKVLTPSDVKGNLLRMLLRSVDQTDFTGVSSEKDTRSLMRIRKLGESMKVNIIEPTLEHGIADLRIWNMKKKYYVLTGQEWISMVTRHGLKVNTEVHLWAFNIGEDMRFALCKMPPTQDQS